MNLREDKHWSYGSFTFFRDAKGQRPFVTYAPVQTDKTKEVVDRAPEGAARHPRPIGRRRRTEIARAKSELTLTLPGTWETMGAVAGTLADIVTFGLDDRYYDTYGDQVRAQDAGDGHARRRRRSIHPDRPGLGRGRATGPRSRPGIRELNLGEIKFIDADGKPLGAS